MAITTIDKSQYRNFSCKLGKKNKITKVKGKEYIIDANSSTSYEEGNKEFAPSQLGGTEAHNGSNNHFTNMAFFDWSADYYLRQEVHSKVIRYRFVVTGKTITNLDGMTAKYTLYYKHYTNSSQVVNSSNYNKSYSNMVFSSIRTDGNRPSSAYNEETHTYSEFDGSTDTTIPTTVASAYYDNIGDFSDTIGYAYPYYFPTHYCNVKYVGKKKNADGVNYDYTFEIEMQFTYSTASNRVAINWWTGKLCEHKNDCYEVVKVAISVSGYTVTKEEVTSDYCPSGDDKYILELQTNELMQQCTTPVSLNAGQKVISFTDVATEIINAYKDNRLIITFDLINNRKYTINGKQRYLQAGDKIKIKDINGEYISSQGTADGNEFEIIKANSKWNGFFYREITAKEILSTTNIAPVKYYIGYDTLGNGGVTSIQFNCPSEAAAGEKVNFTISVIASNLEVTNVMLEDENGEAVDGLTSANGIYSFSMPAHPVIVIVYLMTP